MRVKGLNGREYNLNLQKYNSNDRVKKSFYHICASDIIREVFCGYNVYEEVKLPGSTKPSKRSVLFLDFFIPNARIGVEVHGQQHFKFIPFFHKTRAGFAKSRARDHDKQEWCNVNDIKLVALRFDEDPEHWREKLELAR